MGLFLEARCACGYSRQALRLGGSHAQIAAHDVSHYEVFEAPCCRELQSVLLRMGESPPATGCDRCGAPLPFAKEHRHRISTMKGEKLDGHRCPRCGEARLGYRSTGSFV